MDQLLEQLLELWHGIWLRRFWGLLAAWLIAVPGLGFTLLAPSKYEASTKIFVDTQSVLKPLMVGLTVQPNTDRQVRMLADTLMSRPNVENLIGVAGLDRSVKSTQDRNKLIEELTAGVQLARSDKDNLFTLSYRHADPTRAKRVIDSLLSMFVELGLNNRRRDTTKAVQFLDEQIKDYEEMLKEAERRLKDFKLQNLDHLTTSSDSVGTMLALDSEIEKAHSELRAAEQRRDVLRRQLAGEDPVFLSDGADGGSRGPVPGDGLAEIDARAEALRRNLDELLRKYTEQHPDVVGTRRILADLEKEREAVLEQRRHAKPGAPEIGSTRRLPNVVYQQLKVALAEAEASVAALAGRISDLESRYNRIRATARLKPQFEEQLAQLNRDYLIQKSNFEQLVQRREQAKMTEQLDESGLDFRVIDPPRVSATPVEPNRLQLLMITVLLSLGAGVGCSFVVSRVLPTVYTVKQLQALVQTSILGSISYWPTPRMLLRRKRNNYAFTSAVVALFALFGATLTVLIVSVRIG